MTPPNLKISQFENLKMIRHSDFNTSDLRESIREKKIQLAGNAKLKIYGTLHCSSGKRMKKENRVFFESVKDATQNGYRPCGHCMREDYLEWISLRS